MSSARPFVAAGLLGLLAVLSLAASAQQVFRIVGPDGRVTFSDRPPPDAAGRATTAPTIQLPADTAPNLPFELRAAAIKYPVVIYSRPGCGPCDSGRIYLASRGIPFAERTVTSQEDIEALARLSGTPMLPFATIGGQQIKGFSQVEWSQFLDAAGYPKTSQLPANYRQPAPAPLVAAASARTAPAGGQQEEPTSQGQPLSPPSTGPAPANPAGIQF